MKLAAAAAAVLTSTSMWLAIGTADASATPKVTALRVVPEWTYEGTGKLAVMVECPASSEEKVVFSAMLPGPVDMRSGGNLLIDVTDKTKAGRYGIELLCEAARGVVTGFDEKWVKILAPVPGWPMLPAPSLPAHFKPNATVQTGSPVKAR